MNDGVGTPWEKMIVKIIAEFRERIEKSEFDFKELKEKWSELYDVVRSLGKIFNFEIVRTEDRVLTWDIPLNYSMNRPKEDKPTNCEHCGEPLEGNEHFPIRDHVCSIEKPTEEVKHCNDCKVEQWIIDDPEEWIAYEFCQKRCKFYKPKEDKPTIPPPHEHVWMSSDYDCVCVHCTLTKKEFDEKTKPKDSEPICPICFKEGYESEEVHQTHIIAEKDREIERLKSELNKDYTLGERLILQFDVDKKDKIIERALDEIDETNKYLQSEEFQVDLTVEMLFMRVVKILESMKKILGGKQ